MAKKAYKKIKCQKLSAGRFNTVDANITIEKEMHVHINGTHLFTASITPAMEKEFVAGYLYSQGFIDSAREIKSIKVDGDDMIAVLAKGTEPISINASYRIVSGGGRTAYAGDFKINKIKSDMRVRLQDIFRAMTMLFEKATLYRETEGVHAAALFTASLEPICVVEDIGRHNTLDKAIGQGLLVGIDFNKTFLVSTGRMAAEMVGKICRAGIPVAATKTAVTAEGLQIARKYGLTLIGFTRDVGTKIHTDMITRVFKKAEMRIYSGAERVI